MGRAFSHKPTTGRVEQRFQEPATSSRLWKTSARAGRLYSPLPRPRYPSRERRRIETHLPAERPSSQAATRIPSANGLARRPRDPQAASCERAQAPLRLRRSSCSAATDSPAHGTSTPSIDAVSRPRPDISSYTGSPATRTQTERRVLASQFLVRSALRWFGTAPKGSCGKHGVSFSTRCHSATTTYWSHALVSPSPLRRAGANGSSQR